MKVAAPVAEPTAEPITEPADDAGFGDFSGEETEEPKNDKPFDDKPFDAGVEANEEEDPKKFIEQLTGKLGQSLRKYTEEKGQPDFDLEKFAINSLLSATNTSKMDDEDKNDIIKKVNTAGNNDSKDSDMGNDDNNSNDGDNNNDGDGGSSNNDAELGDESGETDLDEVNVYENLFLDEPKKMSIFAPEGSAEFMEENRLSEACWKGYKKDGMKTMFGKKYPNCVKISENEVIEEGFGSVLEETEDYVIYEVIEEGKKKKKKTKKDACYHKVKSRYDVWPSAYASGALVKCRNVGAANWGNSTDETIDAENKLVNEAVNNDAKKSLCIQVATRKDIVRPSVQYTQLLMGCIKGTNWSKEVEDLKKEIERRRKFSNNEGLEEAKKRKTDFSKEKEKGLHGWFERRGGGWVDCNTCVDGKCKPCGRKEGESRAEYPSCRPTPTSCKSKGRGKSWGKKSANESEYSVYENNDYTSETNNYMFLQNLKSISDNAADILGMDKDKVGGLITNGNGWVFEHLITSKDDVEEVYHFLEFNLERQSDMNTESKMMSENKESNNDMFWSSLKTIHHASSEILEMDFEDVDAILCDGHGWAVDHIATSADDMEEVYHFLANTLDAYDGDTESDYEDEFGNVQVDELYEGKYDGKPLGKPMKGDVKKFKVYVKNKKGNVIKVNFGDPNMEIKRDDPKRRKSFRARHKCAQAKDRTTPKYWSCKMWSKTPVSKMVSENLVNPEKSSTFDKKYLANKLQETFNQEDMKNAEPQTAPAPVRTPTTKPDETRPVQPSRKNKPFLPIREVQPDPKAMTESANKLPIYFNSFSEAVQAAAGYAEGKGFDINEDEWFNTVATGKRKPQEGDTNRYTITLYKDGKEQRKALHFQVYGMKTKYELNAYIS